VCDLLVAMPDATVGGRIIFGKNSDRPAGECQVLYFGSSRPGRPASRVKCSYVGVPDSEGAMATMGCRPYWCWGYETGLNEAGVVGGNAAVFTRAGRDGRSRAKPGLTGMELLRFGLERGGTAEYAVEAITELLERYGQWGSAVRGRRHAEGSYENSFLLADRREAWALETAGRRWAAQRVVEGTRTISNELTIRREWDVASEDLVDHAIEGGWWPRGRGEFDFACAYNDHEHYPRQVSHIRRMRTRELLNGNPGLIDERTIMGILRDHYEGTFIGGPQFNRYLPDFHTVCMHESPAGFTWGDTATSAVVALDLDRDDPPLMWTAYLPPCTSVYLPFAFSESLPEAATLTGPAGLGGRRPSTARPDRFEAGSLWWRMHRLVKAVAEDPSARLPRLRSILDPVEEAYLERARGGSCGPAPGDPRAWNEALSVELSELLVSLGGLEREWELK
jgi:secernin